MRRFIAAVIAASLLFIPTGLLARSPVSADGTFRYNEEATYTLRASATETTTAIQTGTAVAGFGGMCQLSVFVDITAVSFTGGTAPTAALSVWVQHTIDGGTTWNDLLALKSAALAAAATEKDVGFFSCNIGTPAVPAAIQNGGGTPAFAQRSAYLSDSIRLRWQLTVTGAPTAQNVTFAVTAQAKPS